MNFSMRCIWIFSLGLMLGLSSPTASAETYAKALSQCKNSDPETRIKNCSQIIGGGAVEPEVWYLRGTAYLEIHNWDLAIKDLVGAIALQPKFGEAQRALGYARLAKGDYGRAIENFSKAVEVNSDDFKAYEGRGAAYLKLNNLDQAGRDFDKAVSLGSKDPVTIEDRNSVYKKLNKKVPVTNSNASVESVKNRAANSRPSSMAEPQSLAVNKISRSLSFMRGSSKFAFDVDLPAGSDVSTNGTDTEIKIGSIQLKIRLTQDYYRTCADTVSERIDNKKAEGFETAKKSVDNNDYCTLILIKKTDNGGYRYATSFYTYMGSCSCYLVLHFYFDGSVLDEYKIKRNQILASVLSLQKAVQSNASAEATQQEGLEPGEEAAFDDAGNQSAAAEQNVDFDALQQKINSKGQRRYLSWTDAPSYSQSETAYDTCSHLWNNDRYFEKYTPKTLVVGYNDHRAECFAKWSNLASSANALVESAITSALEDCKTKFSKCSIFATNNVISTWALKEEGRIANKSRFREDRSGNRSADNRSGGVTLGGVLDILSAGINGYAAGQGIGTAISGGGSVSNGGASPKCGPGYFLASPGYGKPFTCQPYGSGTAVVKKYGESSISGGN